MREVARRIGAPAATVSQCEKGQRAVKEPKLDLWAKALGVDKKWLREQWEHFQNEYPEGAIVRRYGKSSEPDQILAALKRLTGPERTLALGYIHGLLASRSLREELTDG